MTMQLGLTKEQLTERKKGIGGSDAPKIMRGEWFSLWEEKTGRREPDDLSKVLPVQLGSFTEPFNAYWFTLTTGRHLTTKNAAGEAYVRVSQEHPFMRCTLDGYVGVPKEPPQAIWQAKHVSGRDPVDAVVQRYLPQVTHEMVVCGLDRAVLSLLIGTDKFEAVDIELDEFYAALLVDREREFWGFVESGKAPPDAPPMEAPKMTKELRKIDMTGNNRWSIYAADWLANKQPAALFDAAGKGLKALVEEDVGEASGHGVIVKRDKRGLSIKGV